MAIKEGDAVVYGKTGTTGRVVRLTKLNGYVWAELDSTGLLYDANILEPTDPSNLKKGKREDKEMKEEEGKVETKREGRERRSGIEDMKDEGTLDSSAGICGAG